MSLQIFVLPYIHTHKFSAFISKLDFSYVNGKYVNKKIWPIKALHLAVQLKTCTGAVYTLLRVVK